MALAYALHHIESNALARITNYGEFLQKLPPEQDVEIFENTAWSCTHGMGRWKDNCGCNSGGPAGHRRGVSRFAKPSIGCATVIEPCYVEQAASFLKDPWNARNDYIDVILDRSEPAREPIFAQACRRET